MLDGKVNLLDAQPLEHAALCGHSRDQLGDNLPILVGEILFEIHEAVHVSVLADHPDKDFEVLLRPIFLYLPVLQHLVNPAPDHPHDRLVADVAGNHPTALVELRAVDQDVRPQLTLPVLVEPLHEFDKPSFGLEQSLHRNRALKGLLGLWGLLRVIGALI